MLIKSIELNNFRIYKGYNKIDILPQQDKNIIVISGKNGFGKTTLLMSLVWCLYGKQMDKVDELYKKEISDKGGYGKFIGKSLNRIAEQEGKTKFSVSITFTDIKIPEIQCNEIKITRSYDTKTGIQDELEILIDGYPNELIDDLSKNNQNGGEIFIRDFILPLEIAKFFFFDAEKIVSLAEVNSFEQRKALGIAYSEVLGIHKYEELKNQLLAIQDELKKNDASAKDRMEFTQIESEIKQITIQLEELEDKLEELNEEKVEKKYLTDEIQKKLIREGKLMTTEQLQELKDEESELEEKIKNLETQLKDLFDLIPFALAGEIVSEVAEQVKKEKKLNQIKFTIEDYDNKINTILSELEFNIAQRFKDTNLIIDRNIKKVYEEEIEKLIKNHFYKNLEENENIEPIHNFTDIQISDLNGIITNLTQSFKEKFTSIISEYNQAKTKLNSIRRKINTAEKDSEDPYVKGLREEKSKLETKIEEIDNQIKQNLIKIGEFSQDRTNNLRRLEELRKKIHVSERNKDINEVIESEIKTIKSFITKFKEEKKKSLEQKMKDKLNTLMHKKDFITRVEVDINIVGDNVEINLFTESNGKERRIDKGSLSMGERQMYASALLSALVEESNIDFPVFIDSPIQKFDDDHATNVIKYFYPTVSKQVVLFPLIHTELPESKYNLLKPRVSKAFLIINENNESSRFLEVDPNDLIKKYNEYYVASN